jgi:N-acetylglucosaminyldiphosphoundecaprenol N-acetyl-beta-D-mannosaminyltransferase
MTDGTAAFANIRFDHYHMDMLVQKLFDENSNNLVITPNIDHIIRANKNKQLLELYSEADICVNDSRVLRNISRLMNKDLGDVIPGSDLTKQIFNHSAFSTKSITVIGAEEKVIKDLKRKYNIGSVFHYNPPMGFIDDEGEVDKCIDFVLNHPSRFVFFAVGSPRQEILAVKCKERGATGNLLCIGASLLFLSGDEHRAPLLIRKLSLEWFFRMIQDPKRLFKRYFLNSIEIIPLLFREKLKK